MKLTYNTVTDEVNNIVTDEANNIVTDEVSLLVLHLKNDFHNVIMCS